MFQHNGYISHFNKIKRQLQARIPDDIFHAVHGNTDSEWAFALFLSMVHAVHVSVAKKGWMWNSRVFFFVQFPGISDAT